MASPEMNSKPIGFIMMPDSQKEAFAKLADHQKGYVLHWCRSNRRARLTWDTWSWLVRRAKEQRP